MHKLRITISLLLLLGLLNMNGHAQEIDSVDLWNDDVDMEHVYDSSENYFNRIKPEDGRPSKNRTMAEQGHAARIAAYKKDKAFWYVEEVEEIEQQYVELSLKIDSMRRIQKAPKNFTDQQRKQEREANVRLSALETRKFLQPSEWWILLLLVIIIAGVLFLYLQGQRVWARKNRALNDGEAAGQVEDIFSYPYATRIARAEQDRAFALAIRLRYLLLLKSLSEKGLLRYRHDLTNMDYLMQLRGSFHYSAFASVTRHYEYSWYGQFPVSGESYAIIRKEFEELQKRITA